ncbi:MAG: acetylornithine transaminase [Nitriliruptoraceae bacterium]
MTLRDDAVAHVMSTYPAPRATFVRGEGSWLVDADGDRWLDFLSGLAVTSLGHAHPAVTRAVAEQAATLVHTSNLFVTPPAVELASRLGALAGWPDARTFFAQCGATANEAALKLARRHGKRIDADKHRVVALEGSFHGRTFATLEATGQLQKHVPYEPLLGTVDHVPFDDADALRAAVDERTCAVLVEVIQGEGGVRTVPAAVLETARQVCDAADALLIVDEVQTGIARTGPWFAWQNSGIVPDVFTLAKALANGLPIGACVAHGDAAQVFEPGDHATTFGGNPVTSAAALAVLDTLEGGVRDASRARAEQVRAGLDALIADGLGRGVRGAGMLLGLELSQPVAAAVESACDARRLVVNAVAPDVVRLAPPLTVSDEEVDMALTRLRDALNDVKEAA